jgi:hypothetical protein
LANAIALFGLRKPQLVAQLTNDLPTLADLLVFHDFFLETVAIVTV